jgi:hypothetical protein
MWKAAFAGHEIDAVSAETDQKRLMLERFQSEVCGSAHTLSPLQPGQVVIGRGFRSGGCVGNASRRPSDQTAQRAVGCAESGLRLLWRRIQRCVSGPTDIYGRHRLQQQLKQQQGLARAA